MMDLTLHRVGAWASIISVPLAILLFFVGKDLAAIILVGVAVLGIAGCLVSFLRHKPEGPKVLNKEPTLVTSTEPRSVIELDGAFLVSPKGAFSTWLYLQPFNEGIRFLENNRYIITHADLNGQLATFGEKREYVNTFALSRGPRNWAPPSSPCWKIVLRNDKGDAKDILTPDVNGLVPGWHHFILRWDHARPVLELLIDGHMFIQSSPATDDYDYRYFWPKKVDGPARLGRWYGDAAVHFIESWLWRSFSSVDFLDDEWVKRELRRKPPALPKQARR